MSSLNTSDPSDQPSNSNQDGNTEANEPTRLGWVIEPPGPPPCPSPPILPEAFESALDRHHTYYCVATNVVGAAQRDLDRRILFKATFLSGRAGGITLRTLPPELLQFFCYKDAAIYTREAISWYLFEAVYSEWYPTRDRSVFNDGLFTGPGAAFF